MPALKVTEERFVQSSNTPYAVAVVLSSSAVTVEGIVIDVRLLQLINAVAPIVVTPSGIFMLERFVQFLKQFLPILVAVLLSNTTFDRLWQFLNISSPKPLRTLPDLNVTFVRSGQLLKAPA